jgi:hypothetical protein
MSRIKCFNWKYTLMYVFLFLILLITEIQQASEKTGGVND